ncbi:hypothetical protein L1049_024325 [Liquidambar formosana]|uniref:Uncharacterized protein n=1 Tax=Liquidambar formosana TaxID=63359 RepID=A0AAP0S1S0_LIQFO
MLTMSPQCNARLGNKHLLDFLRNCLLSSEIEENEDWICDPIPCATELLQAGVKFKIGEENDLPNIKFNDGVMEIPPILIQETTESLFRNLIALEQCDPGCDNEITYYAVILDFLINSSKNVDFLRGKGIVLSARSPEDIVGFFNGLYNGTLQ